MQTTLLSSKGQVIIPKALREALRWGPGTRLQVHDTLDGVLLKPAAGGKKLALRSGLAAIRKHIDYRGPTVSLEQMDGAILREAARTMPHAKNSVRKPRAKP